MAAPQILTLTEFAERLRINGTTEEQRFAKEILDNEDDLDAAYQAALAAQAYLGDTALNDPVAVVEEFHRRVEAAAKEIRELTKQVAVEQRRHRDLRMIFVEVGAITDDDTESDLPALLRALLS